MHRVWAMLNYSTNLAMITTDQSTAKFSQVRTMTLPEVMGRYKKTCELKMPIDREKIKSSLDEWLLRLIGERAAVHFLENVEEVKKAARAAWDVRAARARVRAARAAWAARDAAWDAARAARDAARAGRDAWAAAWAGRDAWSAWDARDAWDVSWNSTLFIGAMGSNDEKQVKIWYPFFEAFEAGAFALWVGEGVIHVTERPHGFLCDNKRRLHCESGPAFSWLSDIREYYWHGVRVEEMVVLRPQEISIAKIEAEKNAEVRRTLIERYGQSRYLLDSGAKEISRDDFGVLYRKDIRGDESLVMVKVVNSTAEPDGSFKDYFLRVPPTVKTAHEAVAWTFAVESEHYQPLAQS